MRFFLRLSLLLPLFLLLAMGCGKKGPKLVPVSGKVLMDGQPLANANVSFQPVAKLPDGTTAPDASATTDAEGRYSLKALEGGISPEGAAPGKYTVRITLFDRNATYKVEAMVKQGVEKVPAKYNTQSKMEFTVPETGTDKADFLDLTSK
jgi:predicted small lipoprotein YifL